VFIAFIHLMLKLYTKINAPRRERERVVGLVAMVKNASEKDENVRKETRKRK